MKKNVLFLMFVIVLLLGACGRTKEIDLTKYVRYEISGVNGKGKMFLSLDEQLYADAAEKTDKLSAKEIRRIIEDAYTRTVELLEANMDKLHAVAQGLMELETLDAEQFERLFNGEPLENLKAEFDEKQSEKQRQQEEVRRQARERQAREEQLKILQRNYGQAQPGEPAVRQRDADWQELREYDDMRSGISGREQGPVNKKPEGPGEESPNKGSDQEDL